MNPSGEMTFWDHLDVLRGDIIRILVAAVVMGMGAFCLKDLLFDVVLWPRSPEFPTYQLLGAEPFQLKLINTELTEQFMIHMKVALIVGLLVASPYIVYVLGTYSVSADVETLLTLSSYVDTLLVMSLLFGIVFEIPVVAWLLAKFGILKASWMSQYRRHAIVAILIIAAIITPTADVMTLLVVSLPIWLLYEASIGIVKVTS